MKNRNRLERLISDLIAIDSQNPPGNEARIAYYVARHLKSLGLKVRAIEFKKNRTNIIALLKGKNSRESLLLTPHLDTVPAGRDWSKNPFKASMNGARLYGLGASDCKGNLACGMEAINRIVEKGVRLPYDLIFAATADEESGSSLGLIPLLEKSLICASQALVLDADDFGIIVSQKGLLHLKVKIRGKKAHGAYPHLGTNAIDQAVCVLAKLKEHGLPRAGKHRYLRPPTMNIGTIRGGDKVNVVAGWCEFELDFRFLPGMRAQEIIKRLKLIACACSRSFQVEIEGIQQPYAITDKHILVRSLFEAMKQAGAHPVIRGSEGATVITFFQQKNIPAIATGFGCDACAHMADEYANISNLHKGALALEIFLKNYKI